MDIDSVARKISQDDPEWMKKIRIEGARTFQETSMPHPKDESWKYTKLSGIDFSLVSEEDTKVSINKLDDKVTAVQMTEAMKKYPDEIRNYFLKTQFSESEKKFISLNNSLFRNGYFVYIPEGVEANDITIDLFSESSSFTHSIIVLEKNSSVNIFEKLSSSDNSNFFFNISEIFLGENSRLNFFHKQNLGRNAFNLTVKNSMIHKDAEMNLVAGAFGGMLNRCRFENKLLGEGAKSETICMFSGNHDQHFDIIANAHHIAPNTKNNILTRGTVFDSCSSVFRGLIRIEKDAQRTDSYLGDHTLLMSEKALANSIPSLQIEANDVRATHGVSVGQVNEEEIFYLMSRGIDRKNAEKLIVSGFFSKFLSKIQNVHIRKEYENSIESKVV